MGGPANTYTLQYAMPFGLFAAPPAPPPPPPPSIVEQLPELLAAFSAWVLPSLYFFAIVAAVLVTALIGYATYCVYFPPQVTDIREHCCVVTGASQGLGKQFAKTLAAEGVTKLVLAARSVDKLEKVKSDVRSAHPLCSVLVVPADVTDAAARDNLVEKSVLHAGSNKITLINNAGWESKQHINHPPTASSAKKFDMIIDLNLRAMMHLTHAFMPHLVKNGGHVVNIGSLASRSAAPFQAAYNATKFGMVGFSRCSPRHPSAASARECLADSHHVPSPPPLAADPCGWSARCMVGRCLCLRSTPARSWATRAWVKRCVS